MKKGLFIPIVSALLLLLSNFSFGQKFNAVPNFPDENGSVVLSYDATGTILEGVDPVYIYPFVTTQRDATIEKVAWASVGSTPELLTTKNGNIYTITIPGIRTFFNVPSDRSINKLTVIFRNQTGSGNIQTADLPVNVSNANSVNAVATISPVSPMDNESVVVTFDASKGNQAFQTVTGDVFAYTFLNTQFGGSTNPAAWGDEDLNPALKLTSVTGFPNLYTLTIAGIRSLYTVSGTTKINSLGFIFKNADNNIFGREINDKDVIVPVNIKAKQIITLNNIANTTISGGSQGSVAIVASITSSNMLSYVVSSTPANIATLSGTNISVSNAGTVTVTASQMGNFEFVAATSVSKTFMVSVTALPVAQIITFPTIAGVVLVSETMPMKVFTITGSSNSGAAVDYSIQTSPLNIATLQGNVVTIMGVGMVTITGSKGSVTGYNAATPVVRTFSVRIVPKLLTVTPTIPQANSQAVFQFSLEAQSNAGIINVSEDLFVYAFGYYNLGTQTGVFFQKAAWGDVNTTPGLRLTRDTMEPNIYNLTIPNIRAFFNDLPNQGLITELVLIARNGAGSSQTANLSVSISGTNNTIAGKSMQTITFGALDNQSISGGSLGAISLSASASSGLAVTYSIATSPAGIATLSGSSLSFNGGGTVTVTASQVGNADFFTATGVSRSFTVVTISGPVPKPLLSTVPRIPTLDAPFVIYFNADAATGVPVGLKTITGDVFIYAGVSTAGKTFQFQNYGWTDVSTTPGLKMTKLTVGPAGETNLYALTVTSFRTFFNVPTSVAGADLTGIDIIFRNGAGTIQTADLKIILGAAGTITGISVTADNLGKVTVYPNPSQGAFSIVSSSNGAYSIYSLTGTSVASGTLVSGINPVSHSLASGIYLLRVGSSVTRLVVE